MAEDEDIITALNSLQVQSTVKIFFVCIGKSENSDSACWKRTDIELARDDERIWDIADHH